MKFLEISQTACLLFDIQEFDEDMIDKEIFFDLEKAFSMMTERQRAVVTMYYLDGMGVQEIADVYGISHQAVSVTLSDVKKKFQKNRKKFC